MQFPPPGYNSTPEYMASGLPYLTSSNTSAGTALHLSFPLVTKFITVNAIGSPATFSFTANGLIGTNNYTVASGSAYTMEVRVKEMWVTGSTFCVAAGLTGIPVDRVPYLTGSVITSSSDPYCTGSNAFINALIYPGCG